MPILLALVLGTLGGAWWMPPPWSVTLAAFGALCVFAHTVPRARRACLWAVSCIAGTHWGGWVGAPPPLAGSSGGPLEVIGEVAGREPCEGELGVLRLEAVYAGGLAVPGSVTTAVPCVNALPAIGARVSVRGELVGKAAGANPGVGGARPDVPLRWRVVGVEEAPEVFEKSALFHRTRLNRELRDELVLPSATATGLYRALLLGDMADVEGDTRDAFADTGTAHILAISGLHLTIVGLGLRRVLLWLCVLGLPRLRQTARLPAVAGGLALAATWAFVALVGRSDATWRAAVVLSVLLGGEVLGRRAQGSRALWLAAGAILLVDPFAVAGASFQLSFAAAAALILVHPHVRRITTWIRAPERGVGAGWAAVGGWVGALFGATLAAFAATAPVSQAWFGQAAPLGLLVNLGAVPVSSMAVLPIGFAWWLLSLVSPEAAGAVAWLPDAVGRWYLEVTQGWADLAGPATGGGWPLAVGVLFSLAVLMLLRATRTALLGALLAAGAGAIWLVGDRPEGLRLTALDVGHGDAVLVELPEGPAVLVDTGGTWREGGQNRALARHTLVPALVRRGVGRIDALLITHAHPDHLGAARDLVERLPVGELWLPPCGLGHAGFDRLARAVLARGGTVRVLTRGASAPWGGVKLDVLWPPADSVRPDGECRYGLNDGSVVLRVAYAGRSVLLTGDIEEAAERALLASGEALGADVLKVPHHGSRTSSTEAFIDAVQPKLAVVSGDYRTRSRFPPHLEVLERYQARAVPTYVTGRDGALTVEISPQGTLEVALPASGRVPPGPVGLRSDGP